MPVRAAAAAAVREASRGSAVAFGQMHLEVCL